MGISLAAALFKLLNLRRKRRAKPESLEHALGVPELDNFRLRAEIYIGEGHKIVVQKDILRRCEAV